MTGREELLAAATALVPLLRARARWVDEHRRLPDDVLTALERSGLLRMALPREYGGYESDARSFVDVLAEIATGDTSVAFTLTAYAAQSWNASVWPDEALAEVYGTPHLRLAGTAAPSGTATRTRGGWLLDGSWRYCTGFLHSQWCLGAAQPADGSGPPLYCLVPSPELEVVDDWHTYGLRGTGSVSVTARRVLVPEHRVISVDAFRRSAHASRALAARPHYRVPALVLGQALMTGQFFGGARYALSGFLQRLPGRPLAFTDYASQREAPVTHLQVAEAALRVEDAEARAHRFTDLIARKVAADEEWTVAERVAARAQTGWVARQCTAAVATLVRASGAGSLYREVPIHRIHQDLQAAALHAFVVPSVNLEMYGRTLVGLEPNSAFL